LPTKRRAQEVDTSGRLNKRGLHVNGLSEELLTIYVALHFFIIGESYGPKH
jgi:hypothetical protein